MCYFIEVMECIIYLGTSFPAFSPTGPQLVCFVFLFLLAELHKTVIVETDELERPAIKMSGSKRLATARHKNKCKRASFTPSVITCLVFTC